MPGSAVPRDGEEQPEPRAVETRCAPVGRWTAASGLYAKALPCRLAMPEVRERSTAEVT